MIAASAMVLPASASPAIDVSVLFREHGAFVARVVRRLTGDGAHVDDLVQETFIVAHRRARSFEGRSAPSTWLYGIASRLCMRHNRGGRRFAAFLSRLVKEDATPAERPDSSLEREQDIAAVRDAVGKLPFKLREAFVLYELEGIEGPQIAEMLGVPEGTVWRRVHDARKHFRATMEKRMRR